jgi:hypothetical protein
MDGVALEEGRRKLHLGHAEIADGGAERRLVDGDADHQAEGEQRVHQRLAELALRLGEVPVDMQRLRVIGEAGEQDVVHLRDGSPDRVLEHRAFGKLLEI